MYEPEDKTLKAEDRSLKLLFAGPGGAINRLALFKLKDLGFKVHASSLSIVSKAAKMSYLSYLLGVLAKLHRSP
jgi:hypothetical protein